MSPVVPRRDVSVRLHVICVPLCNLFLRQCSHLLSRKCFEQRQYCIFVLPCHVDAAHNLRYAWRIDVEVLFARIVVPQCGIEGAQQRIEVPQQRKEVLRQYKVGAR
mgnify:CR=1 FL=1